MILTFMLRSHRMRVYPFVSNLYALWWGAFIYILDDGGELTLIDVGMFGAARRIMKAVQKLGAVRNILITHADIDHVACLSEVQRMTGAKVYAGELSASYLHAAASPPHVPALLLPALTLAQRFQKPLRPDVIIQESDKLPIAGGIEVIATPGHTPDSLSFLWQGVIFSGDLFKVNRGRLGLNYPYLMHDAHAARTSARKVLGRDDVRIVCGGHDAPFILAHHPVDVDRLTAE